MAEYSSAGFLDEIARLSLGHGGEPSQLPPPDLEDGCILPIEITATFTEAVKALSPGDIVKDGLFSLYESVSALEIMDPKMDSGCVESEQEVDLEELYDVSWPLLPEEVLGIMDQLLCHEVAWHMGYNLSMTLFTSFYLEALLTPNPKSIHEAYFIRSDSHDSNDHPMIETLRAFCLGMLKTCGYVNERIKSEHFYEEEDFVTNTYSRTMLGSIPTNDIRKVITDTRKLLASLAGSIDGKVLQALDRRLEFRSLFLDANESPQHMNKPELVKKPWEQVVAILPDIKSTHSLGRPVDQAFSVKLQKKLASTMPPKPVVELKFDDAFRHLSRLFEDGAELANVFNYTDPQCLQSFVHNFQAKKPQPLVYLRVLLQTFLFDSMMILGSMSIRQLLDDDFAIVSLAASPYLDRGNDEIEFTQDPRFAMSQQMELFRQRAAQPYLDMLRTFCQNRCRIRRGLCHRICDWENLQVDAEEIDQILQVKTRETPARGASPVDGSPIDEYSLPLSSWTYLYKLRQMEWIVQLGFELEVYQKDELAGMYWYLNYLAKWRVQHVERIKSFILRRFQATRQSPNRSIDRQLERSLAFVRLSLLDAAVTWELSDALSCLYTVLARLGLVKAPLRPYSDDELRYHLRMKPFVPIGLPTLPTFEEYTTGTLQPEASSQDLLRYAENALGGAKKGFEVLSKLPPEDSFSVGSHDRYVASIRNGLKSSIAAGIAISAVQKALQRKQDGGELAIGAEVPTPDKSYHEWWIVPRIVSVR